LIVAALATIVPAAVHFTPSKEQFSNFTSLAGMWHYHSLVELRTTDRVNIDLFHLTGTVTFPSFHAAAATLVTYAARGVPFVAMPLFALNALMIVSTIPEGGHYLVDVIAGVLIAVACILARAVRASS
jgi:membrane-associated phospholipid phosphatase